MKTRIITALIFGVIMIVGNLLSQETCAILYILVGGLCLRELVKLVLVQDSRPPYNSIRTFFSILIGLLPALLIFDSLRSPYPIIFSGYAHWLFLLFFLFFIFELRARSSKPFHNIAFTLLGLFYLGLPTILLTAISLQAVSGRFLIMSILLFMWANDVFAYFAGSAWGKHKIFPHISPNKTWEGTLGGFVATILWGIASYFIFTVGLRAMGDDYSLEYTMGQWMILGAAASVFGIIGDLIASMLKRSLGIKDTGNTLPGHGGLIDRFDSFIFSVPAIIFIIIFIFEDSRFIIW